MLTTQINPLPQEIWNQILIYCDANHLANLRVSKLFVDIVENSSQFILNNFKLDRQENGNFRRIVCLESLIRQLTKKEDTEGFSRECGLLGRDNCIEMGINPYNYRTPSLDLTNPEELKVEEYKKDFFNNQIKSIKKKCQKWLPPSLSIQKFLEVAQIAIKCTGKRLTIRKIAMMTPHVFSNHPAKKDFYDLINRNVEDSQLSLSYDPIKAKRLLKENFSELNDEIVYALYFYLLELDIEGLISLVTLIQENKWSPDQIWEIRVPGLKNILTTPIENKTEVFVNFLNLFEPSINGTTDKKSITFHAAEKGHAEILKKLTIKNIDSYSYHYAKNTEIANVLFEKVNNNDAIHFPLSNNSRSPLLTAILKDNHEVATWLINKGAWLYDNWDKFLKTKVDLHKPLLEYTRNQKSFQLLTKAAKTSTLVKFLFQTSLREDRIFKWIALKELTYRAIRITAIALAFFTFAVVALAIIEPF